MSVHIPDVQRAYSELYIVKKRLNLAISELRKTIIQNNMPRDVAHEVFFQTQTDATIKGMLIELSIAIGHGSNLISGINASNAKRGRKFRHWERMLDEIMAKANKDYGIMMGKHGKPPEWSNVPDVPE